MGSGWRIPTIEEWQTIEGEGINWRTQEDAYNSLLKLHNAGQLYYIKGDLQYAYTGFYWSSSASSSGDGYICNSSSASYSGANNATAEPIRCIRDTIVELLPALGNVSIKELSVSSEVECSSVVILDGDCEVTERGFVGTQQEHLP